MSESVVGGRGGFVNLSLRFYNMVYQRVARPFLFRMSAQDAHTFTLDFLRGLDRQVWLLRLLALFRRQGTPAQPITARLAATWSF